MKLRNLLADLMVLASIALITGGIAQWTVPGAMVALGLMLGALAIRMYR